MTLSRVLLLPVVLVLYLFSVFWVGTVLQLQAVFHGEQDFPSIPTRVEIPGRVTGDSGVGQVRPKTAVQARWRTSGNHYRSTQQRWLPIRDTSFNSNVWLPWGRLCSVHVKACNSNGQGHFAGQATDTAEIRRLQCSAWSSASCTALMMCNTKIRWPRRASS